MSRNRILLGIASIAVITGGFVAGALLSDARAEASLLARQVEVQEARIDELRATAREMQERLGERERNIAHLQDAIGESGPLAVHYGELASRYAALRTEHETMLTQYGSLVRIRTPELAGDALWFDRSVRGVKYTGAVCSGSMEPNITCNDLLLLYEPSVTDLRVGDIIYFRRQAPGCTGALEGRFMLHRITRVSAGSEGLRFHTKGDALSVPDACPVPASDVMYKLLTNVRNARIQQ